MGPAPVNQKIIIPSRLEEVGPVVTGLMELAQRFQFSEDDQFAIRLALDEAIINAIRHGNRCDASKTVRIDFRISTRQCRVTVTDQGCGFCPGRLPDPTLDENLERPNGRGVMLMKAYMNKVQYNTRGNGVTLVKIRNAPLGILPSA